MHQQVISLFVVLVALGLPYQNQNLQIGKKEKLHTGRHTTMLSVSMSPMPASSQPP